MARPRTPIGAYGKITTKRHGKGWLASTRFRNARGQLPRVKRTGPTKTAAENRLKEALTVLIAEATSGRISRNTRFKRVAELWYEEAEVELNLGLKSPNTLSSYRTGLGHILPSLGELCMYEVDTPTCNHFMLAKRKAGMKFSLASTVRSVLSSVCGYAARNGALDANPVRDIARLRRAEDEVKEVRALTTKERDDLFAKLDQDPDAVRIDIPDMLRGLLSVGCRISELLACTGDDLTRDPRIDRLVLVLDYRIVRMPGQGLVRRRRTDTSTKGGGQTLIVARWAEKMLTERKLASGGKGPLFPNPHRGGWRDPNGNTMNQLRAAMDQAGYEWVGSHDMRRHVANEGGLAGKPVEEIAAQVGHKDTSITRKHYIERRTTNEAMLDVMDGFFPTEESGS